MSPRRAASLLSVLLLSSACSQGPALRGKMRGLTTTVADAEKNGAMTCAPRELAIAKSQLEFAEIDLDQGEFSEAVSPIEQAEPNALAAFSMSPADRCTSREFIEIAAPPPPPPEVDKDTDGDGIPDSRDQCLLEPEDKDGYLDDDGCPDPDNDADGIPDSKDQCPNEPEDFDGFKDDDGCPDPDNDGDGVADVDDFCPNTPGVTGGDKPGCPKKNNFIVVTEKEIRITQQIQFEFNKAVIKPGISYKILDEVVAVLVDNAKFTIEVQGHTDNVGADEYNLHLSQARADAVKAYLVAHGVDPSAPAVQRLRLPPAARAERHAREPRPEPPRSVHSHGVGDAAHHARALTRLKSRLWPLCGLTCSTCSARRRIPTCNALLSTPSLGGAFRGWSSSSPASSSLGPHRLIRAPRKRRRRSRRRRSKRTTSTSTTPAPSRSSSRPSPSAMATSATRR